MPKHLFVFSDGTWFDPEKDTPGNVFRLATMLSYRCPLGNPQLVFYDPGVGTEGSVLDRLMGGAVGSGIDLNIQQLYTFLVMNYEEGDHIYLFGFSRGAYTVRSLAGMISEAGLLRRDKMDEVKEAYDLYRENEDPESEVARAFREKNSRRVPIKLLACFDTVGALGLPVNSLPFGDLFVNTKKYQFHDTKVGEEVEHAIHILSIDEERKGFLPTYMEPHPSRGPDQVTEVFMPGRHSGIGGGDPLEKCFSDNALRFMISEMERRGLKIGFRNDLMPEADRSLNAPLQKPDFMYTLIKVLAGKQCRDIRSVDSLHESAIQRYCQVENWRPSALDKFRDLDSFTRKIENFKQTMT